MRYQPRMGVARDRRTDRVGYAGRSARTGGVSRDRTLEVKEHVKTAYAFAAAAVATTGLVAAATAWAGGTPLTTTRVASGLTQPLFITHAPNDHERVFVVEKAGRI